MRYLTAGESHGKKLVIIIDEVVAGVKLNSDDIDFELKRRSSGPGRSSRQNTESNKSNIVSGVVNGKTTGNPVCVEIYNCFEEAKEEDFIPRPGHADLNGIIKYNFDSCKNVSERASARETAASVVAGVLAKNILAEFGAEVFGFVSSIGSVSIDFNPANMFSDIPSQADVAMSTIMCPDQECSNLMTEQIERAKENGDSLGGSFIIVSTGVVPGLGSYSQSCHRLNSKISSAISGVPSVKSVEIGSADYMCGNVGSASADQIVKDDNGGFVRLSNYSGGIEGGLSNGMPIVVKAKVKPVPSIKRAVKTVDLNNMQEISYKNNRRFDVCVVPNACVVAENQLAFVLVNEYIKKFGCDNLNDIKYNLDIYKQRYKLIK